MLRALAIVAAAAAVTAANAASPSCFDDSGSPVDWFIAIKDSNAGTYTMATSNSTKMQRSSENLQDGSRGGVSLTVQQLWNKQYSTGAYNDQPGFKASSKFGHTKGFVVADEQQAIWMVHSIPNWPLVTGAAYDGLPDYEIIYAQSMLCFTMSLHDFNRTVGQALQHNRPAVYVNAIAPGLQQKLSGVVAGLNGIHIKHSSTMQQTITTLGGEQFTVFAKTAKWASDLYSQLVAPALRSSLWAETWIRGYAVGPVCSGAYSVVDVTGVTFGGQSWTETQDHSKWAVSTPTSNESWLCVGDINRMTSQQKRGGGTVCLRNPSMWQAFSGAVTGHDSCPSPALRGAGKAASVKPESAMQASPKTRPLQAGMSVTIGETVQASVARNSYAHFMVSNFVPNAHPDFTIEVSPVTGQADLYVNIGGGSGNFPTYDEADLQSTEFGVDSVRITKDDALVQQNCPDATQVCTIFISITNSDLVVASVAFQMIIVATGNTDSTILELDSTVIGAINVPPGTSASLYEYFQLPDIGSGSLTVTLTSITGDADMYIGYAGQGVSHPINRPTMEDNAGKSVSLGNDELKVQCPNGVVTCDLYIGVHGFANMNTSFAILVTAPGDSIQLQSGVAQVGNLTRGATQRYTFRLPDSPVRTASIWVLPVSGDPDLYVNVNGQLPTPANSQKHSFHRNGPESVLLTPGWLATQKAPCAPGGTCTATIAVVAYDDCEYLITASGNGGTENFTALSSGVPQTGSPVHVGGLP